MRLVIYCSRCDEEALAGQHDMPTSSTAELREDGLYDITCVNGHRTLSVLQLHRHEVLFEMAAHAILDGYYREAVASFAASLERFYEFFIRSKFYEDGVPVEVIESAWKGVGGSSERQLGAFIFLYTQTFKSSPTLLHKLKTEFRNKVIHKGLIPSKEDALDFGQAVLDVIRPILNQMRPVFGKGIQAVVDDNLRKPVLNIDFGPVTTKWTQTILGQELHSQKALIESLVEVKWWKDRTDRIKNETYL